MSTRACVLCNHSTDDALQLGEKLTVEDTTAHLYCLVSIFISFFVKICFFLLFNVILRQEILYLLRYQYSTWNPRFICITQSHRDTHRTWTFTKYYCIVWTTSLFTQQFSMLLNPDKKTQNMFLIKLIASTKIEV